MITQLLQFLRKGEQASRSRVPGLPPLADLLVGTLCIAALFLTWGQWATIFADRTAAIPIVGAAVFSVLGGLVVVHKTRASAHSVPIGLLLLILSCALWYGQRSRHLIADLAGSWKSLASTGLLVPSEAEFVLVPVLTIWLAGWAMAEIVGRRRPITAIFLAIGGAHAVAIAYTVSQQQPRFWIIAALCIVAFLMVGIRAADSHAEHADTGGGTGGLAGLDQTAAIRWRQALIAVPLALGVTAFGVGFDRLVSGGSPDSFDLRERLVRPLDVFEATSPLSRVKTGLISPAPADVFTIVVDGLATDDSVEYIHVASLDLYDGAIWSSSARFETAGALLPPPEQPQGLDALSISQTVKIESAYPFTFLPRIGQVTKTDSPFLGWDPRSGSLANIETSVEAFTYATFVRMSTKLEPTGAELDQPIDQLRYATAYPELTDEQRPAFESLLSEASDGATTKLEMLENLEQLLRSEAFAYNPNAPGGHSMAALASYLDPATANGQANDSDGASPSIGFTEQSAATFAVAARQLGVPSRIVVGYRLPTPLRWDHGREVVTEDMIHAWPEVWFNEVGWVRFEPTNTSNSTSEQTARTPAVGDDASASRAAALPDLQDPVLIPDLREASATQRRLIILAIAMAVPLLVLVGIVILKRVRRQRRRTGEPAERITGAWQEARETLEVFGLPSSRSSTVIELAEQLNEAGHMKVAIPVAKMASTVTSALYAPEAPSAEQADAMWAESDAVRTEAHRVVPIARRLRAAADPRSLISR